MPVSKTRKKTVACMTHVTEPYVLKILVLLFSYLFCVRMW
jgi:hypothetical protein